MKLFTRLIAVFGFAAGVAAAQPPQGPPGGLLDIERLAVLLDLDPYQKGEVERALNEQREARLKARQEHGESVEPPSPEAARARREQGREELLGKLANTLTEQQMTKLKLLTEQPRAGRGGPGAF